MEQALAVVPGADDLRRRFDLSRAKSHQTACIVAFQKHFGRCGCCKMTGGKMSLCEVGEACLDECIRAGASRYRIEYSAAGAA